MLWSDTGTGAQREAVALDDEVRDLLDATEDRVMSNVSLFAQGTDPAVAERILTAPGMRVFRAFLRGDFEHRDIDSIWAAIRPFGDKLRLLVDEGGVPSRETDLIQSVRSLEARADDSAVFDLLERARGAAEDVRSSAVVYLRQYAAGEAGPSGEEALVILAIRFSGLLYAARALGCYVRSISG